MPTEGRVVTHEVSVVIPLYNKELYIRRAIESALRQTISPAEIIVVDDGSTDRGPQIVKSFSSPPVIVTTQPNQGPGVARNAGIRIASTDWVALLDADDVWLPNHLEEIARLIDAFPRAGLLSTTFVRADTDDALNVHIDNGDRQLRQVDYFSEAIGNVGLVSSSTGALRRSVALQLGGFGNERYGEDITLWVRVALDYQIAISDRKTAVYARRTGGQTESAIVEDDVPVMSISEIYPFLKVLETQREARSWIQYPPNIGAYIEHWLFQDLKWSIYRRQFTRARSVASLMNSGRRAEHLLWRSMAMHPRVLSATLRARDALRNSRRPP